MRYQIDNNAAPAIWALSRLRFAAKEGVPWVGGREKALVVTNPTIARKRVDKETGEVTVVPGYASAHDLRRSFGTRWSQKVMPRVLMQLMRHTSITTTMKFYVESNADSVQAELWNLAGNTLGNSSENQGSEEQEATESEKL